MADLPTYPLTTEGVEQALAALDKGGSEDVAMRLAELGIVGVRDNECGCPVAAYLSRTVDGVEGIQVGGDSAYLTGVVREVLDGGFIQSYDVRIHVDLSAAVSAFVEDFDQGIYPELIQSAEEANVDA